MLWSPLRVRLLCGTACFDIWWCPYSPTCWNYASSPHIRYEQNTSCLLGPVTTRKATANKRSDLYTLRGLGHSPRLELAPSARGLFKSPTDSLSRRSEIGGRCEGCKRTWV